MARSFGAWVAAIGLLFYIVVFYKVYEKLPSSLHLVTLFEVHGSGLHVYNMFLEPKQVVSHTTSNTYPEYAQRVTRLIGPPEKGSWI